MASGTIKGITIELGADVSKLTTALSGVQKETRNTQSALSQVNSALKFDTTSTSLLTEKQSLLRDRVSEAKDKLDLLKTAQVSMDASGVDKNSDQYRALQREIAVAETNVKSAKKELSDFGDVGSQKLSALGELLKGVGEKLSDVGGKIATKVTAPLVALGTVSVAKFAEVDKTMQLVNATMGNTAEEAQLIGDAMKNAASESTYSMNDAATATLNFARAGLNAEEASSALAPAMNLAAGEGGNLDTVSQGLVSTINGFGGSFSEASSYADVFANACNNSALDIDTLSEAMSIAAPIFSAAGYSVNDAALYIGVMADAGISANEAANALKTGMARLVSPTDEAKTYLDRLGLSITNADGTMKDSVQLQGELHNAFGQLSESEQIAAASAIFGKNQMSNWLALINAAPESVATLKDSLSEEGTATEMSTAMMSGFGGAIEKLKSSIDVAATSFGEALAPTIQEVTDGIQSLMDWFNSLDSETQQRIASFALIAAAIGPVLIVIGQVISAIGSILTVLSGVFTALKVVGAIIGAIASPIGIVVVAVGALVGAFATLYATNEKFRNGVNEIWGGIKDTIGGTLTNIKDTASEAWTNMKDNMSQRLNEMKSVYDEHGGGLKGTAAVLLDNIKSRYQQTYEGINELTGGKLGEAVNIAKERMSNMKDGVAEKLSNIKTNTSESFGNVKESISSKLNSAKETASNLLSRLSSTFNSNGGDISSVTSQFMSNVQGSIGDRLYSAYGDAHNILGYIADSFFDNFDYAKKVVKNAINYIKGLFDFSWSLPDIALPHFSISGSFSLNPPSVPSIGISWYDKGGIFSSPTVIGVGEKRPEFVGALDDLRAIVREEAGGSTDTGIMSLMNVMVQMVKTQNAMQERLINACEEYFPTFGQSELVLDTGALVGELTPGIDRELGKLYRRSKV